MKSPSNRARRSSPIPYTNFPRQYQESRKKTLQALEKVFEKGDFILGAEEEQLERRFAHLCGVTHAVGVANGTDALILALKAIDIQPGDEVITAPNSFVATAGAIVMAGAKPVFVDIREDLNIDPTKIEKAITPRTRAILPVHLAGQCADMDAINETARRHRLPVIEDAAQSAGAKYRGKPSGSLGTVGCFSMHPLKNLNAAGDAGMLTTQDSSLAERFRLLRNHGLKNRDEVVSWGMNSRLDTLQAAILNLRMNQLPRVINRRRQIAQRYRRRLERIVTCPTERPECYHTYHLFVILAERRDALQRHLAEHGIETKIHYPIPIHLQKCAEGLGYQRGRFPVCEDLAGKVLSLPVHQFLTDADVDRVAAAIVEFYQKGNT